MHYMSASIRYYHDYESTYYQALFTQPKLWPFSRNPLALLT
jgi:hypothetical protein